MHYKKTSNKIIVVVLENPHEFEYEGNKPLGPAMGRTGSLFFKYFETLLNKMDFPNYTYDVILMNSVQYQASRGLPIKNENKTIRDNNWLEIFTNFKKNDFINRVNKLKPDVVINMCTKGNINIFNMVETELLSTPHTYNYFYSPHPCRWNFVRYIK